jgi:lipopolysaccharide/colanic/teichoic acid biosynthesis glycosyltransferase
MVRLDLKYAETWSPWLDIKILLRTPRAVFAGEGAY